MMYKIYAFISCVSFLCLFTVSSYGHTNPAPHNKTETQNYLLFEQFNPNILNDSVQSAPQQEVIIIGKRNRASRLRLRYRRK